jgi:hypothetical protein
MNDFYELANRYLAMFEGASVKCHSDIDPSKVNKKKSVSRRDSCDLYLANGEKSINLQQAGTATTVICRIPGLDDWPFHSKSGDNFIYSKDSAIVEALGCTSTLPPEHLRDEPEEDAPFDGSSVAEGEENDEDTWTEPTMW